jgi:hypothetical protein
LRRAALVLEVKPLADRTPEQLKASMKKRENTFAVTLAANQNEK